MIHAPYNFIPFHTVTNNDPATGTQVKVERVIVRYPSLGDLPRHDAADPALKTGEIHVTITAKTPVFVSDGNQHFFRGPNGKLMIPGSTVRGLVRENMQILGFGLIRPEEDLDDFQIYFREIASSRESAAGPLKDYYHAVLNVESGVGKDGKRYSIPTAVKAGYLNCTGGKYYIQPVPHDAAIRLPRDHRALQAANLAEGMAKTERVAYHRMGVSVDRIQLSSGPVPGMESGVLLYTGRQATAQPNARYLFPEPDLDAEKVWIPSQDIISYQEDYETRKNVLGINKEFWALPGEGESKPVFYLRHEGHIYFGMSYFPRIGYRHALSEGLPRNVSPADGTDTPLDYVHSILGFAEKQSSYKSRVSFGDFCPVGNPSEQGPIRAVLLGPKPGWYPGYLLDGKHYNEDDFALRGYKLYWLKDKADVSPPKPADSDSGSDSKKKDPAPVRKENKAVGSELRPLPAKTQFRGVIRYKNLHEDELGLLLWALRLEENCDQNLGMGKPFGFGRVHLTIDQLLEYDFSKLYGPGDLCASAAPAPAAAEKVAEYIRKYESYAEGILFPSQASPAKAKKGKKNRSIRSQAAIQDFFFMRSAVISSEQAEYMALGDYSNIAGSLPTVSDFRKEAEEEEKRRNAAAGTPEITEENMREMLMKRFNKKL